MALLDELGFELELAIPNIFAEGFGLPFRPTRGTQGSAWWCNRHVIGGSGV